jgi:hypothetical protein
LHAAASKYGRLCIQMDLPSGELKWVLAAQDDHITAAW